MKRIIFTIFISTFMSSIFSIAGYKKFLEKKSLVYPNIQQNIQQTRGKSEFIKKPSSSSSYSSPSFPNFTQVVEKTINTVVNVKNYSNKFIYDEEIDPIDLFFGSPNPDEYLDKKSNHKNSLIPNNKYDMPGFHGSGVIVSNNGYIVTNYHVVKDSEKIEVVLNNQKSYTAKLIGVDPETDLALLKINEKNLPFIIFSDSDKVKIGEWVLAIGNPFDLNSTVTAGIISAKNRNLGLLRGESNSRIESFFQTDAAVNPGNSGGPLININGELIGINTAISSSSGSFIGYSFASPSNLVFKVIQDIKKYGVVKRPALGIQGINLYGLKNIYKQHGFLVEKVFVGGSAYNAGIRNGDIIKKINNTPINNTADLYLVIGIKNPGDKISITVLRGKKLLIFNVVLKEQELFNIKKYNGFYKKK